MDEESLSQIEGALRMAYDLLAKVHNGTDLDQKSYANVRAMLQAASEKLNDHRILVKMRQDAADYTDEASRRSSEIQE